MSPAQVNGMVSLKSQDSFDDTLSKLLTILGEKGIRVFAVVNHGGEAAKVGMKMPSTVVVIFGSPKAGTPLMLAAPSIAIDLPLKILVAEDETGGVWVSYNSADYLRERHHVPQELIASVAVIAVLAAKVAE